MNQPTKLQQLKRFPNNYPTIKSFLEELHKEAHMGVSGGTLIWGFTEDQWRELIEPKNSVPVV